MNYLPLAVRVVRRLDFQLNQETRSEAYLHGLACDTLAYALKRWRPGRNLPFRRYLRRRIGEAIVNAWRTRWRALSGDQQEAERAAWRAEQEASAFALFVDQLPADLHPVGKAFWVDRETRRRIAARLKVSVAEVGVLLQRCRDALRPLQDAAREAVRVQRKAVTA